MNSSLAGPDLAVQDPSGGDLVRSILVRDQTEAMVRVDGCDGIVFPWRCELDESDLRCGGRDPQPAFWSFPCIQLSQLASRWVARPFFILDFNQEVCVLF